MVKKTVSRRANRLTVMHLGTFLMAAAAAVILIPPLPAAAKDLRQHDAFNLLARRQFAAVSYERQFPGEITDQGTEISLNQASAQLVFPVANWGSGAFAVGAQYFLNAFSLDNITGQAPSIEEGAHLLHMAGLGLGFLQVLSDDWYLTLGLHPYISSDFKEFDLDVLFIEGRVEAGWAYSPSLAFRFGVATHARFGMYLPFPILGLAYHPQGSRFKLDALLPKYFKARLRLTDNLELDLLGELFPQVWDINQEGLGKLFKYMRVKVGVGITLRLWKMMSLRVAGGLIPLRIMDSYGVEGTDAQEYSLRADPVPFIDTTIRFGKGG